jgi:membrane protein
MKALRLLGSALLKFNRDNCLFMASGIAFQMVLCLIPLMLLVLSVAGSYLFTDANIVEFLGQSLEKVAPALDPALQHNIMEVVSHRGTSGIVGTIGLLWIATTLFASLRTALDDILGVHKPHGLLKGLAFDVVMVALSGAAFLLSFGLTAIVEYLRRRPTRLLPAETSELLYVSLSHVLPFLISLLICYLIYHLVPSRRVSARSALGGALFTGIFLEGAKHLFAWYVLTWKSHSIVYGSLSAAAVLLAWSYYSAAILLLGAEVIALVEWRSGDAAAAARPVTSPTAGRAAPIDSD